MSGRYTSIAIALHWLIAMAILLQVASGLWMEDAIKDPATKAFAYDVFQWHKALGLSVLVLSLFRLIWRLIHRPPELPDSMKKSEKWLAHIGHWMLYALMIAIPLTGWVVVSTSVYGLPTMFFGLFEWPHLPWISELSNKNQWHDFAEGAHGLMAYAMMGLLGGHIIAALKHHFINRDEVLTRMVPGLKVRKG